jgi:hypothetical protein
MFRIWRKPGHTGSFGHQDNLSSDDLARDPDPVERRENNWTASRRCTTAVRICCCSSKNELQTNPITIHRRDGYIHPHAPPSSATLELLQLPQVPALMCLHPPPTKTTTTTAATKTTKKQ